MSSELAGEVVGPAVPDPAPALAVVPPAPAAAPGTAGPKATRAPAAPPVPVASVVAVTDEPPAAVDPEPETPVSTMPASSTVPAMSATRRMRSRLTRRMSGQRTPAAAGRTVLEPLFAVHRALHPKADLKVMQFAYETLPADRLLDTDLDVSSSTSAALTECWRSLNRIPPLNSHHLDRRCDRSSRLRRKLAAV